MIVLICHSGPLSSSGVVELRETSVLLKDTPAGRMLADTGLEP